MTRVRAVLSTSLALALMPAAASAATNTITTVAGTGTAGSTGDGGPASAARLNTPAMIAATADGGYLIADNMNNKVRKVSASGVITTVAGTGTAGNTGNGGLATAAQLNRPIGVAATADGGFLIADSGNGLVRKVAPGANPTITTVAGGGNNGTGTGPATNAALALPSSVAPTADGGFLIADALSKLVRKVAPGANPTITTVAGGGNNGLGDGGPATAAQLNMPFGVTVLPSGAFLVSDQADERVRLVSPGGRITTVAGTGAFANMLGDGGLAIDAELAGPYSTASTPDGGYLIGDYASNPGPPPTAPNSRVRKVLNGTMTTVAGTGTPGFTGDGGLATAAQLNAPTGLIVLADGDFLISDTANNRIRRVDAGGSDTTTTPPGNTGNPSTTVTPAPASPAPLKMVVPRLAFSKLSLSPRAPKAASAAKAKLTFTLTVAGRVSVRLDQRVTGRRSGRRCTKATRANRKKKACKRAVKVGSRTVTGRAGANSLTLGTLKKKLTKGSYSVTFSARGAATKSLAVTVKK